ncbi:hypothetical protein P9112_013793 [Eukaryota sp. TZLM1-RC]
MRNILYIAFLALCVSAVMADTTDPNPTETPTPPNTEKHSFTAEVSRLMELIIHSLYSNSDIFLREAISNASDAIDRMRHLSLQDPSALGDLTRLDIRIRADNDTRKLYISDTGTGLTRAHLSDYLGRIANSGTQQFVEAMKAQDMNAIGQFGVGFYSLFLVSDLITVHTKHNNDTHLVWQSDAREGYSIYEETDEDYLSVVRGTTIELDLKEDADEYLGMVKLEGLIKKYSGFITYPIYLYDYEEVEEEIPAEEVEISQEEEEEVSDDVDQNDDVEDQKEEETPKTRMVKKFYYRHINDQPAIWMRPPREVEQEEYNDFYKSISNDEEDPLTYTHFKAEGEYEFRGLLFVPSHHVTNLIDEFERCKLRLYVKRVFIGDDLVDLLPRWLNFLKGIVDSDDLPLNVSREQLQKTKALRAIQNRLVKKALDMLKKLAKDQPEEYSKFYNDFGRFLKVGMIEDTKSREKLSRLMRFPSSHTGKDNTTSFEEYIERMPSHQTQIYYVVADSLESGLSLPFVEQLHLAGYEVIVFTDPLDEPAVASVGRFDEHEIVPASKEDVKANEKDDNPDFERLETEFEPVRKYMKTVLENDVEKVVVSKRLVSSPATLVHPTGSASANMERLIRQQQQLDPSQKIPGYSQRRILEINPYHPVLVGLKDKFALLPDENESEDTFEADLDADQIKNLEEEIKSAIHLLHDAALLQAGYEYSDYNALASRIYKILSHDLGVASNKVDMEAIMKNIVKASDVVEEEVEEAEEEVEDDYEVDFDEPQEEVFEEAFEEEL